jgi:outer membrane protein TolC
VRALLAVVALGCAGAAAAASAEPLDLAELLSEAAASNPEILAAEARRSAAEHLVPRAQARPDPLVSVSYTNESASDFTLGSAPDASLAFSWMQELPYPGKRRLSGDVARAEVDFRGRTIEATRARVLAAVKLEYVELHRLERTRAILEHSRTLLRSLLETARARYETGQGILENVLRAQTESTRLEAALAGLAQQTRSSGARLNALLGRPADTPLGPARAAPRLEVPDPGALERAALERSPELQLLRAAAGREQSRLDLARRDLKPDLVWGASYMNRGGLEPMLMGSLGVRLPLYRRTKQAEAVVQSEHELRASRRDVESGEARVLSEVRDLLARAERARAVSRLYREGIVPQARSALDSAAASYAVGRAEFVTLIDDFLSALRYELEHETERADEAAALAALEARTGSVLLSAATGDAGGGGGGSHE